MQPERGVQYVSAAYTSLLIDAGIQISMTESGDPKDNAVAERQNNTIKNELLKDIKFHSIGEVRRAMEKAVAKIVVKMVMVKMVIFIFYFSHLALI